MKLVIIDDEVNGIKVITNYLQGSKDKYEIVGSFTNPIKALDEIDLLEPDVLLVDIEMPEMTGFELLNKLDLRHINVIFVTAFDHYAIKAIKHSALDYLLKPFSSHELYEALDKAERHLENGNLRKLGFKQGQPQYVIIPSLNTYTKVDFNEMVYAEGQRGGYTTFHLKDGRKSMASRPLAFYQEILPENFVKIHKSHIINLDEMKKFHSAKHKVEMKSGTVLDLAHRRKSDFLKVLRDYM